MTLAELDALLLEIARRELDEQRLVARKVKLQTELDTVIRELESVRQFMGQTDHVLVKLAAALRPRIEELKLALP